MRRVSWVIGLVIGVLLVAGSGIVRWAVAPALTVLPSDTNTTRVYTGTATSLLNPVALTGTLFGPAMLHNVPATVRHEVRVTDTKGNNALVADHRTVTVPGHVVADLKDNYAVDRKTLGRGSGFTGVTRQTGVTFNWPLHARAHDYTGWVTDTQSTTTLTYRGEDVRGGVKTFLYDTTVPTARITDPQLLATLPAAMPKSMLDSMVGTLGLTRAQLEKLASVLPTLPDPVPFAYTYSATSTFWVAPDSGIVVDVSSHEVRTSNLVVGNTLVPVSPVMDLTYTSPPVTLAAAAADAKDATAQLRLITDTLPLALLIVGGVILLLVVSLASVAWRRVRVTAVPPAGAETERELTTVG